MIIPITFPTSDEKRLAPKLPGNLIKVSDSEYVLVELQGTIHCSDDKAREGQVVGTLALDDAVVRRFPLFGWLVGCGVLRILLFPLTRLFLDFGVLCTETCSAKLNR